MPALLDKVRASALHTEPPARQRIKSAVVGLAGFAALIAVNSVVIQVLFDQDYLRLYLSYGAVLNLVVLLFTLAWGDALERHTSLISAHPIEYLAGNVALGVAIGGAGGALLLPGRKQFEREVAAGAEIRAANARLKKQLRAIGAMPNAGKLGDELERLASSTDDPDGTERELPRTPLDLGFVDAVISLVLVACVLLTLVAWVLLVVPVQYFVYLIAGAPAREALGSPARAWLRVTREQIVVTTDSKFREIPAGATESGYSAKPITLTAAFAAVLLFALDRLLA